MATLAIWASFTLFVLSYLLFMLGQLYPVFHFHSSFSGGGILFQGQTNTLSSTVSELWVEAHYFPVILLICFSFVVPIFKFFVGLFAVVQPSLIRWVRRVGLSRVCPGSKQLISIKALQDNEAFTPIESFLVTLLIKFKPIDLLRKISKYQMADTFMSVILIAGLKSDLVHINILPGGFYFWGYCLLSLTATQCLSLSFSNLYSQKARESPPETFPLVEAASHVSLYPSLNPVNPPSLLSSHGQQAVVTSSSSWPTRISKDTASSRASSSSENAMKASNFPYSMNLKSFSLHATLSMMNFFMVLSILSFSLVIFMMSKSMSVSIAILDKDIDIWRNNLSGYDIMMRLWHSPYTFNGLLTFLVFPVILPCLQAIMFMAILVELLVSFTAEHYSLIKRRSHAQDPLMPHISSPPKPALTASNPFILGTDAPPPLLSLPSPMDRFSPSHVKFPQDFSSFDICLFKTLKKHPKFEKYIRFSTYLVDWCMADVFCLGVISAFFTINAMSVLKSSYPNPTPPISGFWFLYAYGISSFIFGIASNSLYSYTHALWNRQSAALLSSSSERRIPQTTTSFFFIHEECFCDSKLILPPSEEYFYDPMDTSSLLRAHARDTRQRNTSEDSPESSPPSTRLHNRFPFTKWMGILLFVWTTLMAVVGTFTFHFKIRHPVLNIDELNKDLISFNYLINVAAPNTLPFSIGGNCSASPQPCEYIGRDPLYVYNFSKTISVDVNWISGLDTLTMINMTYHVLPEGRLALHSYMKWDSIIMDILAKECPGKGTPCITLLNSSTACCGNNINVFSSLSVKCKTGSQTAPFQDIKVDNLTISTIYISLKTLGLTIDIAPILEKQGKAKINALLDRKTPLILWNGKKQTIQAILNSIAKLNIYGNSFHCPSPIHTNASFPLLT
ncbi:hypothetical protein IE077_003911 [Cardiosporidium cionae]|uniref:Uncharacterized protein n=1 Tax=Cardiosporidium cionae TaxID=476202 RepID=A0ABQ7J768_9APIC|nr:hypothetical protein IE077_003911 [Cardiosporidium cionae]|eukprot:KAF8819836.1 hypothetical protein IE077_003911 [Cardiosporidium cionae]